MSDHPEAVVTVPTVEPAGMSLKTVQRLLAEEALSRFGSLRLRVTGTSMLPTIWPGDELTIHSATIDQLHAGDLVMFTREDGLCVHRVWCRTGLEKELTLVTRGDAMPTADLPVGPAEVLGKVAEICRGGRKVSSLGSYWLNRAIGVLLCKSDRLRDIALRLHEMRSSAGPWPEVEPS